MPKVVVVGGGIGGLSAAHELIERDFEVEVYEAQPVPGGKARSIPVPDSGTGGRKDLPGEHGFRFFPDFYRHITDTMKRTPFPGNKRGVYDNLVDVGSLALARYDQSGIEWLTRWPRSFDDIIKVIEGLTTDSGLTDEEIGFFSQRIWQLVTSCKERRDTEYEGIGWWTFVKADEFSETYRAMLVYGTTTLLVASEPELASTKTVGNIALHMLFNPDAPIGSKTFNQPTNEAWIEPWLAYLKNRGVQFHPNSKLAGIECVDGGIEYVKMQQGDGEVKKIRGNDYIFALPAEVIAPLLTPEILDADPNLHGVRQIADDVEWMNGIQFYLKQDVPIIDGHVGYVNSEWALSSISQKQFWKEFDLSQHGDGTAGGILSVDISNWRKRGRLFNRSAKDCSRDEIKEEVWAQLKKSLNVEDKVVLEDDNLLTWFLDPAIVIGDGETRNLEPLFVNLVNSWRWRPEAFTQIPNMYLAADYVRTYTDLATMEAANEAARRAVNAILEKEQSNKKRCKIWDQQEPFLFRLWRWRDGRRFHKGLPWDPRIPWFLRWGHRITLEWIRAGMVLRRLFGMGR